MKQQNLITQSPLHQATRLGDLAKLEELIAQGANINSRANLALNRGSYFIQLTPLMVAAEAADGATVETLRFLVEQGADIYAKSEGGVTAAWYAAGNVLQNKDSQNTFTSDQVSRLEYLLNLGLNPHEKGLNGRSLLTEASRAGDTARVSLLLRRGAMAVTQSELTESLSYFQIPLFCAAISGSAECVRLILEAGANLNTVDDLNCTALMYAGSCQVAQILIEAGIDIYAVDNYGADALESILECGLTNIEDAERFEIARLLLSVGADIEARDEFGYTRLYSAAFYPAPDSVEFLLKCGANPFAKQSQGKTPLHAVCWGADSRNKDENYAPIGRIIDLLLKAGIDVNAVDEEGNTPLHEAAYGDGGNLTAIRALLKHGAKGDLAADDGMTPLMLASSNGEVESVFLLLEAGASVKKSDSKGLNASDHAQKYYEWMLKKSSESTALNNCGDEYFERELQRANECISLLRQA